MTALYLLIRRRWTVGLGGQKESRDVVFAPQPTASQIANPTSHYGHVLILCQRVSAIWIHAQIDQHRQISTDRSVQTDQYRQVSTAEAEKVPASVSVGIQGRWSTSPMNQIISDNWLGYLVLVASALLAWYLSRGLFGFGS